MDRIRYYLPTILRLGGEHDEVREQVVFAAWQATVGPAENKSRPVSLQRKTLTVAVLNESWKEQMQAMSGQYIFRLNSMLEQPVVTLIEYKVDPAHVDLKVEEMPILESKRSREIRKEFEADADAIDDRGLRESFLRAVSRYLERNEAREKDANYQRRS